MNNSDTDDKLMIATMFYNSLKIGDVYRNSSQCRLYKETCGFLSWEEKSPLAYMTIDELIDITETFPQGKSFLLLDKTRKIKNIHIRTGKYQFKILYNGAIWYLNITNGENIERHFQALKGHVIL